MNREQLEEVILEFIGKEYGTQEYTDPSYDIEKLTDYILNNYSRILEKKCENANK